MAIPIQLAAALTRSPSAPLWLELIDDYPRFLAKLNHLETSVGLKKAEIVEDMTLLMTRESPFLFVPPRLLAKREILHPFQTQTEFCAHLFNIDKSQVYAAAAHDLSVLATKYPTSEWRRSIVKRHMVEIV